MSGWLALLTAWVLATSMVPSLAQTIDSKVAQDLRNVIAAPTTPKVNWVKDVSGVRYVKALIVSDSADPDLVSLRAAVMSTGGSIYMRYLTVRALSVMVPANKVYALAARSDVSNPSNPASLRRSRWAGSMGTMASSSPASRTTTSRAAR